MRVLSFDGTSWTASEQGAGTVQQQIQHDRLTWVRAGGLSIPDSEELGAVFGLHPLAIEDIHSERQRPKVEDYDDLTFAVVRVPRGDGDLAWQQVAIFVGEDFVVTASKDYIPELDAVESRLLQKGLPEASLAPGRLFHVVIDALVDAWFPFMDTLEERIDELEDAAAHSADKECLADIRIAKQIISRARKVTVPMRDATLSLERAEHPHIRLEDQVYLRDVSDHMVRLTERLEHVKEMAMFAQESWNASLANHQNQAMKRLTVLFALFLVPTFLAGLGGMNFPGIPDWDYWTVTGTMFVLIATGFLVALWKRWL